MGSFFQQHSLLGFWDHKAIEIDTTYSEAFYNLGLTYYESGDLLKSVEFYSKAININTNPSYLYNRACVYYELNKYSLAIYDYNNTIKLDSLHANAHYNIALIYEQQKHSEKAIFHYEKFLEYSPESYSTYQSNAKLSVVGLKAKTNNSLPIGT